MDNKIKKPLGHWRVKEKPLMHHPDFWEEECRPPVLWIMLALTGVLVLIIMGLINLFF